MLAAVEVAPAPAQLELVERVVQVAAGMVTLPIAVMVVLERQIVAAVEVVRQIHMLVVLEVLV